MPVSEKPVAPAPVTAIWVQGPAEEPARSTLKPVSLLELSVQVRLIWLEEAAVALRLPGAAGIVPCVVAFAMLEALELPAEL